jgi:hypothetical protein
LLPIHQPAIGFVPLKTREAGAETSARFSPGDRIFHYCSPAPVCGVPGLSAWAGTLRPGEDLREQAERLFRALAPDLPIRYGRGTVAGSDGFMTADQQAFFDVLAALPRDRAVRLLAALGVSGLIGARPLEVEGLRPFVSDPSGALPSIYALPGHAPRAYLAERVVHAGDARSALARMAADDFRSGRDAVIVSDAREIDDPASGSIAKASLGPQSASIRVAMSKSGLLVLGDTWFPGWEATVDGAPAEIIRANGIQRGIELTAGEHSVEIAYRPRSFLWGLRITLLGLALSLAAAATRLFLTRRMER